MRNFQVGDTWENSAGKTVKIKKITGDNATLESSAWNSTYTKDLVEVDDLLESGHYTDYRPVKQEQEYEVGGIFRHISTKGELEITSLNPFRVMILKKPKNGSFQDGVETIPLTYFTVLWGKYYLYIPPNNNQSTMKQWKKEDFLNTKIIVDTPEKSKRFQELMFSLDIKWRGFDSKVQETKYKHLYVWSDYSLVYGSDGKEEFNKESRREIFYDEIFNNSNNQSINNKQNGNKESNDISGEDLSGYGRKEAATACKYSRTCKTTGSSGYIGNEIKGRTAPIRVGRSEIVFQAVSA